MTTTSPTIIDLKTAFLRSQILNLSTPLRPSSTFTSTNASAAAETALRDKAIDDALYKLNAQLRKHNKLVYGPQATRHVAEQIDRLYWNAGERGMRIGGGEEEERWRMVGSDLRDEAILEQLPEEYSAKAAERMPEAAAKFTELSRRLKESSDKRRQTRERLEAYRKLKGMVEAFGEEGGVQENLVTKNGEVERELERMRMLMLRVERGVKGLDKTTTVGHDQEMDWEEGEDQALQVVLKQSG